MLYTTMTSIILLLAVSTSDGHRYLKDPTSHKRPDFGGNNSLADIPRGPNRCQVYVNGKILDLLNRTYDIVRAKERDNIEISPNCLLLLTVYRSNGDKGLDLRIYRKKALGYARKPDFSLLEMDAIETDRYLRNSSTRVKCLDSKDQEIKDWKHRKNVTTHFFDPKLSRCFVADRGLNPPLDPNTVAWTMIGTKQILSQDRRDCRNLVRIITMVPHGRVTKFDDDRIHTVLRAITVPLEDHFIYIRFNLFDSKRASYLFSGQIKRQRSRHVPP